MFALGVLVATLVGFVISGLYYAVVPSATSAGAPARPVPLTVTVELARGAAVSLLVAGLLSSSGTDDAGRGALLGLVLWVLPLVLLAGSVFHEGTPRRSAVVHAGDWLVKLPLVGAVLGAFL